MYSELELPRIYIDTEMVSETSCTIYISLVGGQVSRSGFLDELVFLVLEIQSNLDSFDRRRKVLLEVRNDRYMYLSLVL